MSDGSETAAGSEGITESGADTGTGRARATLVGSEEEVEFDGRDAALLRAVERTGSVASAANDQGRSRARALRRIETLEDGFGPLVERTRGGSGGGGSRLTAAATALLTRHDRLAAAVDAAARVPETVLDGTVTAVDGELATVDTAVGTVRSIHGGVAVGGRVQVRVGADTATLHAPADAPQPGATSARNRVRGTVDAIDAGETVLTIEIRVLTDELASDDGASADVTFRALVTADSAGRLDLAPDEPVVVTWKATATRLVAVE
ncbi:hypothetical protein JCM17823_25480 [Halorubrum gandharaense]